MAQHVTLLTITRSHGGHGLGAAALFFADDLPLPQPSEELTVSHGNPEAIELEGLCPPDDVNEVGLVRARKPVHHHARGGRPAVPVACGAYAEWEGILAHLGVLVAPEWRRRGLGSLAASIAAHEALASGLTLQWRAEVSNNGPLALARQPGLRRRRHPDQRAAGLTLAAARAAAPASAGRERPPRLLSPAQPQAAGAAPQPCNGLGLGEEQGHRRAEQDDGRRQQDRLAHRRRESFMQGLGQAAAEAPSAGRAG